MMPQRFLVMAANYGVYFTWTVKFPGDGSAARGAPFAF